MTPADSVFYNGNVHCVDQRDTIAQAVAVTGGRVTATGGDAAVLQLAAAGAYRHDLQGRSLIPGIIESHIHAVELGVYLQHLFINAIDSIEALTELVARKTASMPRGQWLLGGCWIESQFKERRPPMRQDLDPASPEHPVVLDRIFGACTANSKALELAGITSRTPDPPGGRIERAPHSGRPTGVLHGNAKALVRKVMPHASDTGAIEGAGRADIIRCARRAMRYLVRFGITSIVEPGVSPRLCRAYQHMRMTGDLLLRVNLMPGWRGFTLIQRTRRLDRMIEEMGFFSGFGDSWLRLGALKMAVDGGLTSKTALKSWCYVGGDPQEPVIPRLDPQKLPHWVKQAHDLGWNVGIHVMGDIAIEKAAQALFAAHSANPAPRRHQLIHAYYPTERSLRHMRAAGVIASVQPAFIYSEADGYPDLLPPDRQTDFLPLRAYLDHGIVIAAGSDAPSAHPNPFLGLYSAVTRTGVHGHRLGATQTIGVTDMLRAMTYNGAVMTGEEDQKGSLEPGKLADLAVLDRNLNTTPPQDLKDIQVDLTMIDGRVVYRRQPSV